MKNLPKDLYDACDLIDSAIFSGDTFHCRDNTKELKNMMDRWIKELDNIDKFISELEKGG